MLTEHPLSNSMSHEFYQVMVGSPAMTIHGWKQLAEWSLDYSCLSPEQKIEAHEIFAKDWEEFCEWIVTTYGEIADSLDENGKPTPDVMVEKNGELILDKDGKPLFAAEKA